MSRQGTDNGEFPGAISIGVDATISERGAHREAPRGTGDDYRLVLESASQGIVIAYENTICYANPKVTEYTGYAIQELTSCPFIELIHPDDREIVISHHQDVILERVPSSRLNHRIIDKQGRVRWMEVTGVPFTWEGKASTLLFINDITAQKEIEDRFRQSQETYRDLVENTSDLIYVMDGNGCFKFINQAVEREYGYSASELIGKGFKDIATPQSYALAIKVFKERLTGMSVGSIEYDLYDKDGLIKTIETSERLAWEGNRIVEVYGIARDVTDRKRAEDALRESEEKYRSLVENLNDVICSTDLEGRVTYVSPAIEQITGYPGNDIIGRPIAEFVYPEDLPIFKESHAKTMSGQKEPLEFRAIGKYGEVIHVRTFSRRQYLNGALVGLTGTITDITERVKAEQALRESEEKYRLVLENAGEGIAVALGEYFAYINPKMAEFTGYTREELYSRPIIDFIYPDDHEEFLNAHQKYLSGDGSATTLTHRTVDRHGNLKWAEHTAVPITWDGQPAVLVFVKDVTEQKNILDELAESEEKYRLILENAAEGIAIAYEKELGYVNPLMIKYLGYTRDELLERSFIDFIHPDDREEVIKTHLSLMQGGGDTKTATRRFISKNGSIIWASYTSIPVTWGGQRAVLSFVKDVTEEKNILDALAESEEKYRLVVENADEIIGVTVGDVLQFVNRKAFAIFGYAEHQLVGTSVLDHVHPDDRLPLLRHWTKISHGNERKQPFVMRLIGEGGKVIWTESNIVPILWQGKSAAINIATDITERKRVEDALKESEEKYRLVVENANEIIVITRNGIVEFANSRVLTLFGVQPSALLGRHLSELVIRNDRARLNEELRNLISRVSILPYYRYRMRDAKGNVRCIEVNGIPIVWEGQPSILSFVSDITEKVQAEEELKRRLRYEQALAFCSRAFVPLTDIRRTMQNIVRHLLEKLEVGGVFICKNVMDPVDGISMLTIAEAVADGRKPPFDFPIPEKVAYKYRSREMYDTLSKGCSFGGPTKDYPPVDRDILTAIGSLSSIMIPIFVSDTFWGFIGFDDYEMERVWDEQDILLLQTVSSIIGTAIARKEAKVALTESEQKYRELVDSTSDMIYVADYRGNISFVNNAVRQMGYEPDELIGKNFYEFYAPSSKKYAQELFRLQRTGVEIRGYELDILRKDGQIRTIEFNDDLKWEGEKIVEVRGIGRDVTDRKKMEDRLRLVAGSQEAVLNSLPDMVFFVDLALKITWVNRATSQLTGLSIEEMVGRFCHEVLHRKDAPCEGCPAIAAQATGRFEENSSISCFGKNRRITAYPVPDLSGNITGIAVSIGGIKSKNLLDITESLSQIDDDIEEDNSSEVFLAPLDPNYIYPFSISVDLQKDTFQITLRWEEYGKEHLLKRLARSESAVARLVYLAARMKTDGSGWVDKDIIRAGTMDTNLNKLRSLLEESNVPFLDRFSSRMLIRSNREEKKKVRLALSASNIEISPNIRDFRSKKHRYMDAVLKRIKALERETKNSSQPKEYLVSELSIQHQNEINLKKSIELVETLIGDSAILLKF
jgi:PAS domain S-box-containing protein